MFASWVAFFVGQILWINFCWVWQVINNRVQNQLNTFVLKGRTTVGREELQSTGTFTDATLQIFDGWFCTFFQVFHQQVFVCFQGGFDQLFTVHLNVVSHVSWNVLNFVVFWQARVIPYVSFFAQQVDNTNELVFGTDWQNHNQWPSAQYILNLINNASWFLTEAQHRQSHRIRQYHRPVL